MTKTAKVLLIDNERAFESAVREVSELLRGGGVAALPTETVYGLAANAFDPKAVERIFSLKGRPPSNPVIVHIAGFGMAHECVSSWPNAAEKLAEAFWPGPLTMVLPRSGKIPDVVTAGGETVGIRWPRHPFIEAVIQTCGFPLAAPSANLSNAVSPTHPDHVLKSLGKTIPVIVDGGQSQVGIESTVLDLTVNPPRLLRPGTIRLDSLVAVVGRIETGNVVTSGVFRSPGQLPRHYAPKARLVVHSWGNAIELAPQLRAAGLSALRCHVISHNEIPSEQGLGHVSVLPHDAEAYARAIYAELHRCDADGAELIVVEAVPEGSEWQGIRDRLMRAAESSNSSE